MNPDETMDRVVWVKVLLSCLPVRTMVLANLAWGWGPFLRRDRWRCGV